MACVYGLFDPQSKELRYVGKTVLSLKARLAVHLSVSKIKNRTHKNTWLKSLLSKSLKPEIEVLETHTNNDDLLEAEKFWIEYYRGIGCRLTNETAGGEGVCGRIWSDKSLFKLSQSSKARGMLRSTQEKAWASNTGRKLSFETRKRMSFSRRGKTPSKGLVVTNEHRILLSVANGSKLFIGPDGKEWINKSDAAKNYKISRRSILDVLNRKRKHVRGMYFSYIGDV